LLFSYIISVNYTKLNKFSYGIVPFMAVLGTVAGLMMVQPHLSGTIIICSIGIIMMFVGGSNIKHLMGIGVVGIIGLVVAVIVLIQVAGIGYFQVRIEGFLDPMSDVKDATFQTYQSLVTIGSGGIFGLGLGNSMQKFRYLPESHNDFVFSIVCEELGFIGAMLIIILFSLFIFRGFYIASKSPDKFGMMLAVGLTVQIGLQALLNIAVVTNSIPNTGVSLPFFSYGGTALMMQLFQMGIMLNISRHAALD
ncbi:MAG: FtsW/RodA/SpoVE family cell cycle protein, partial [Clostridiales bacterium]|nr:FtsW/RodA/SpoVE family cell cycle protein [Clostridiales bacterium]